MKMKKSRKRSKKPATSASAHALVSRRRKWRDIRRFGIFSVILLLVTGTALAAFKYKYHIAHDLSVIGQGMPVVVQIHDPKCQLCLRLRRNTSAVIARMDNQILFRIADITTPQGRRLQRRYKAPNVTLLLFDQSGKLHDVLEGVKNDDTLHRAFLAHLNRKENQNRKSAGSERLLIPETLSKLKNLEHS